MRKLTIIGIGLFLVVAYIGGAMMPDNPWSSDPVTVTIEYEHEQMDDYSSEVEQALEYWEDKDDTYGSYTADWELVDESDADVTLKFVTEIDQCGSEVAVHGEFSGCAPQLEADSEGDGTVVKVVGFRDSGEATRTIKHEWGHLYGLNHSEEPQPLMDGTV